MELLSDDVNLGSAQVTLLEIFFLVITNIVVLFTVFPRREKLEGELAGGLEEQVTGVILL